MKDYGRRIYLISLICFTYWPREVFPNYQYPSVFWTPKNCRFNLNKKGPKSAYKFSVKPFGKVYFICPNIALWSDMSNTGPRVSMMYENLMLVDKEGYETCTVNKTRNSKLNRMLLRCDKKADELTYIEETFSPARASSHQMEYLSGKTYYFISTSNGTKESLDNLSGGHCKTHNMKLKITVCDTKGPCPFNMPKCPYSYVFYEKYKPTTTASTHAPTQRSTFAVNNGTKATVVRNSSQTTPEEVVTTESKELAAKRNVVLNLAKTEVPTDPKAAKRSSRETIWGTQRTHIIIHITMALLVFVLTLSFIYILITRRKYQKSSQGQGFSSRLYEERPTSTSMPLDVTPNGNAQSV